mgnify:CR=1 FL=1
MKKIIFRKLLLDCLTFFFLALFGISTIIWVFQAVNFLDIMIEDGRNYNVYFNYTLLNFPKIISRILPFALFFSFSYTFLKYETSNELIIFWNHGVNKMQVINFFFWIYVCYKQHVRTINIYIKPIRQIFSKNWWSKWSKTFSIFYF